MSIEIFVDSRIFYSLALLLAISTGTVFAEGFSVLVETDDNNYDEGDTIVISGEVSTPLPGVNVVIQIFREGTMVAIAQKPIAQDGTFSHTILAEGPLWKKSGTYSVRASYEVGGIIISETEFTYSSKSEVSETTTNFEVDAGSSGTFDVKYTIKGGTVKNMVVDSKTFAIIVQIDATDEGEITLDLPREFIGAEKQDGKDDTFIILIDGIEVESYEPAVHSESRVITINFEQGDSDIEIIGTYVIPEFGTIAMMVLIVGIMATVLATRNKFQIGV
ncbi:MAG: PEFG-CTERM sorting domain-containing protein [Nitrosopumilus sp.]|nr:PEFG-CTERM sorting domain-containing protein [Nitrosopumilus sp.]MDF2426209.1 PEFG-CTERM sorting domain-containing protein [Nitrosopumilus sp.]MDF2426672.1 PEFG-CTERM sorting domain-containing protein [Nitrosopumilus sp.]MDF2430328.1 PEFG-CTERM sorting domain-containing protein [Nitrosopumilus sp.]